MSASVLINELEVNWQQELLLHNEYERERKLMREKKKEDEKKQAELKRSEAASNGDEPGNKQVHMNGDSHHLLSPSHSSSADVSSSSSSSSSPSPASSSASSPPLIEPVWYVMWWRSLLGLCRPSAPDPYKVHAPKPSLGRALSKTYRARFLQAACFQLLIVSLQFAQPILLKKLIAFIITSQAANNGVGVMPNQSLAWVYCCSMFIAPFLVSICNNKCKNRNTHTRKSTARASDREQRKDLFLVMIFFSISFVPILFLFFFC